MLKRENIPNAITVARGFVITPLLGAPFIIYALSHYGYLASPDEYYPFRSWALILTLLGLLSDFLDGHLAKTYGWKSAFGARIDPLMDKWFSYVGFGLVPLYYGFGWYLFWFAPLVWYIDRYSRQTTLMRRRGEILEANESARRKTGFLFAAQVAFAAAIAAEDTSGLLGQEALLVAVYGFFFVALTTMSWAAVLCDKAMKQYEAQAERHRRTQAEQAGTMQPAE